MRSGVQLKGSTGWQGGGGRNLLRRESGEGARTNFCTEFLSFWYTQKIFFAYFCAVRSSQTPYEDRRGYQLTAVLPLPLLAMVGRYQSLKKGGGGGGAVFASSILFRKGREDRFH